MKTLIAPGISDAEARDALRCVERFDSEGRVIYKGRNVVKVFDTPSGLLNVKRYRVPRPINRFIYSFVRSPKGQRGFDYALRLELAGLTPAAVLYAEERRGAMLGFSWLVTRQSILGRMMREFGDKDMTDPVDREIVAAFARFTAMLHERGVVHRDYSPGNILFDRVDGDWRFTVVDTNRAAFGPVSREAGCAEFARLWGQPEMFRIIAREYAEERGFDPEECLRQIARARSRFWHRFMRRHKLKYTYREL